MTDGAEIKADVELCTIGFQMEGGKIRMTKLQEYLEMRDLHVKDMKDLIV